MTFLHKIIHNKVYFMNNFKDTFVKLRICSTACNNCNLYWHKPNQRTQQKTN